MAGDDDRVDGDEDAWATAQQRAEVIRALLATERKRLGTVAVHSGVERWFNSLPPHSQKFLS